MGRLGHAVCAFGLVVSLAAACSGQDVRIDFEHYPGPDGLLGTADDIPTPTTPCPTPPCSGGPVAPLGDQYASVGITFSQGTLHDSPSFWPGHLHYISSSPPIATLSRPARTVSITSYSYWNATLTAYNATDTVIGSSVLTHPSPGGYPFLGTLTVNAAEPIARFSVLPDNPLDILNLDDLFFGNPSSYFTVPPCRLVDTRAEAGDLGGPALAAGSDRTFPLSGHCGIPAGARSVSLNVTVTEATGPGNLRLYAAGTTAPLASTINYGSWQTRANNAVVALDGQGALAVRCTQPSGTAHLVLDVNGYFE